MASKSARNRYDIDIRAIYHRAVRNRRVKPRRDSGYKVRRGGAGRKPVLRGIPNTAGL